MNNELEELDPEFSFDNVFIQNYNDLKNLQIMKGFIEQKIMLDGTETNIGYPNEIFYIEYRDWCNPNWFKLGGPDGKINFWTTLDKAYQWKEKLVSTKEFQSITKEKALELALELTETRLEIKKRLNF